MSALIVDCVVLEIIVYLLARPGLLRSGNQNIPERFEGEASDLSRLGLIDEYTTDSGSPVLIPAWRVQRESAWITARV